MIKERWYLSSNSEQAKVFDLPQSPFPLAPIILYDTSVTCYTVIHKRLKMPWALPNGVTEDCLVRTCAWEDSYFQRIVPRGGFPWYDMIGERSPLIRALLSLSSTLINDISCERSMKYLTTTLEVPNHHFCSWVNVSTWWLPKIYRMPRMAPLLRTT